MKRSHGPHNRPKWSGTRLKCFGIALVLLSMSQAMIHIALATPTTRLVSPTGTDSGDCSAGPCQTIQFAINAAANGDSVLVSPGTYTHSLTLRDGITVVSALGPLVTTIDGGHSGSAVDFARAKDASVSGFTITGGAAGFGGGVSLDFSPSGSLTHNIIQANTGGIGGAISCNGCSVLIDSNIIRGNTTTDIGEPPPSALGVFNAGSSVISNNVVFGNHGPGAIDVTVPSGNNTLVINNTIDRNDGFGVTLDNLGAVVFRNNLVTNNRAGGILCGPRGAATVVFNDVWNNPGGDFLDSFPGHFCAAIAGSGTNFSSDPLYVNPANGDYHLLSGSPAIDTGSPVGAPTHDFDGNPRPLGAGFDIGAYEFQANPVPEPSTWLLLGSGLVALAFARKKLAA